MTQRQAIRFTRLQLLEQYRSMFPELVSVAENSDITSFKSFIAATAFASNNRDASETVLSLLRHDGNTVHELSTGEDLTLGTSVPTERSTRKCNASGWERGSRSIFL